MFARILRNATTGILMHAVLATPIAQVPARGPFVETVSAAPRPSNETTAPPIRIPLQERAGRRAGCPAAVMASSRLGRSAIPGMRSRCCPRISVRHPTRARRSGSQTRRESSRARRTADTTHLIAAVAERAPVMVDSNAPWGAAPRHVSTTAIAACLSFALVTCTVARSEFARRWRA